MAKPHNYENYGRAWYLANKERLSADRKARRIANPGLYREQRRQYYAANSVRIGKRIDNARLKRLFGISRAEFEVMLEAQGGGCAICNRKPNGKRLCVDHCHSTGRIRGILCDHCNKAIGLLNDDVSRLVKTIDYLTPKLEVLAA